jgi:hypothetical protein
LRCLWTRHASRTKSARAEDLVAVVSAETIAGEIVRQLSRRAPHSSICPSEVARALEAEETAWRALMPRVREVAAAMRDERQLRITRKGVDVPGDEWGRGAIRLARGEGFGVVGGGADVKLSP